MTKKSKIKIGLSTFLTTIAVSLPLSFLPSSQPKHAYSLSSQSNTFRTGRNFEEQQNENYKNIWKKDSAFEPKYDEDNSNTGNVLKPKKPGSKTKYEDKILQEYLLSSASSDSKFIAVLNSTNNASVNSGKNNGWRYEPSMPEQPNRNWDEWFNDKNNIVNHNWTLQPLDFSNSKNGYVFSLDKLLPIFFLEELIQKENLLAANPNPNLLPQLVGKNKKPYPNLSIPNLKGENGAISSGEWDVTAQEWKDNNKNLLAETEIYKRIQDRKSQYKYNVSKGFYRNIYLQENNESISTSEDFAPQFVKNEFLSEDKAQLKQWVGRQRLLNDIFHNPNLTTSGRQLEEEVWVNGNNNRPNRPGGTYALNNEVSLFGHQTKYTPVPNSMGVLLNHAGAIGASSGKNGNGKTLIGDFKMYLGDSNKPLAEKDKHLWFANNSLTKTKRYEGELSSLGAYRYMDMPSERLDFSFSTQLELEKYWPNILSAVNGFVFTVFIPPAILVIQPFWWPCHTAANTLRFKTIKSNIFPSASSLSSNVSQDFREVPQMQGSFTPMWGGVVIAGSNWPQQSTEPNLSFFPHSLIPPNEKPLTFSYTHSFASPSGAVNLKFRDDAIELFSKEGFDNMKSFQYKNGGAVMYSHIWTTGAPPYVFPLSSAPGASIEATPYLVVPSWAERSVIFNDSIPYKLIDNLNKLFQDNTPNKQTFGLDTLVFDFSSIKDNLNIFTFSDNEPWTSMFKKSIGENKQTDGEYLFNFLTKQILKGDKKAPFTISQNQHFFHTTNKKLYDYEQKATNLPDLFELNSDMSKIKKILKTPADIDNWVKTHSGDSGSNLEDKLIIAADLYTPNEQVPTKDNIPMLNLMGAIKVPGYDIPLKFHLPEISLAPEVGPNLKLYNSYALLPNQTSWSWLVNFSTEKEKFILDHKTNNFEVSSKNEELLKEIFIKTIGGLIMPISSPKRVILSFLDNNNKPLADIEPIIIHIQQGDGQTVSRKFILGDDEELPFLTVPKGIDLFYWNQNPWITNPSNPEQSFKIDSENPNAINNLTAVVNKIVDAICEKSASKIKLQVPNNSNIDTFVLDLPGSINADAPSLITNAPSNNNFFNLINNKEFFTNGSRNVGEPKELAPYSNITLESMQNDIFNTFYQHVSNNEGFTPAFGSTLANGRIVPTMSKDNIYFSSNPDGSPTFTNKAWLTNSEGFGVWNDARIPLNEKLYFFIRNYYNKDLFLRTNGLAGNGSVGNIDTKSSGTSTIIAPKFYTELFFSWANPNNLFELSSLDKEDKYYKFFKKYKFKTEDFQNVFESDNFVKEISMLSLDLSNPSLVSFWDSSVEQWLSTKNPNETTTNPDEAFSYNPSLTTQPPYVSNWLKEYYSIANTSYLTSTSQLAVSDNSTSPEEPLPPSKQPTSLNILTSKTSDFNKYYRLKNPEAIKEIVKKYKASGLSLVEFFEQPVNQTKDWKQTFVFIFLLEKSLLNITPYNFSLEEDKKQFAELTQLEQAAFTKILPLTDVINLDGVNAAKQPLEQAIIFNTNDSSFSSTTNSQININLLIDNGFLTRQESINYFGADGYLNKLYKGYSATAELSPTPSKSVSNPTFDPRYDKKYYIVNSSIRKNHLNLIKEEVENVRYKLNDNFFLQETLSPQLSFRLSGITTIKDTKFAPNWENIKNDFNIFGETSKFVDRETFFREVQLQPQKYISNIGNPNSLITQVSRMEIYTDPRTKYLYPILYVSVQNYYQNASDPTEMKPSYECKIEFIPDEIKNNASDLTNVWKGVSYPSSTIIDTKSIFGPNKKTLFERLADQKDYNEQNTDKDKFGLPAFYKKSLHNGYTYDPDFDIANGAGFIVSTNTNTKVAVVLVLKHNENGAVKYYRVIACASPSSSSTTPQKQTSQPEQQNYNIDLYDEYTGKHLTTLDSKQANELLTLLTYPSNKELVEIGLNEIAKANILKKEDYFAPYDIYNRLNYYELISSPNSDGIIDMNDFKIIADPNFVQENGLVQATAEKIKKLLKAINDSYRMSGGGYKGEERTMPISEIWDLPFPPINNSLSPSTWGEFITLLTDFGGANNVSYVINKDTAANIEFVYNGFKIVPREPVGNEVPLMFNNYVDENGFIWNNSSPSTKAFAFKETINFTNNIFSAFGVEKKLITNFALTVHEIINDKNNWLNTTSLRTKSPSEWIKWAKEQLNNEKTKIKFLKSIINVNDPKIKNILNEILKNATIRIGVDNSIGTKPVKIEIEYETNLNIYSSSLVLANKKSDPYKDYFYKFSSTPFSLFDAGIVSSSSTAGEVYDWNIDISSISTSSPFYDIISECYKNPYDGLNRLNKILNEGDLSLLSEKDRTTLAPYNEIEIKFLFLQTIIGAKSSFINQFDVKQLENLNINLIIDHINQRIQLDTFSFNVGVDSYSIGMDSLHNTLELNNQMLSSTSAKLCFTNNSNSTLLEINNDKENNNWMIVLITLFSIAALIVVLFLIAFVIRRKIWRERTTTLEHKSERKYTGDF